MVNYSQLIKRLEAINFASIDDFITDNGKELQTRYEKLLEKYNLDGFMDTTGCIFIYAPKKENFVTIGGKDLEDMSGWTIGNSITNEYVEDSWENKDDNYINKSINNLYKECVTRFGKDFANKIKKIIVELNN